MYINKRSLPVAIILTLVTFGLYGIYWYYLLVTNIRTLKQDYSGVAPEMLCIVFVPFYSIYWWYTRGNFVKEELERNGYSPMSDGVLYLILSIFNLSIVSMALMQYDFNTIPDCI